MMKTFNAHLGVSRTPVFAKASSRRRELRSSSPELVNEMDVAKEGGVDTYYSPKGATSSPSPKSKETYDAANAAIVDDVLGCIRQCVAEGRNAHEVQEETSKRKEAWKKKLRIPKQEFKRMWKNVKAAAAQEYPNGVETAAKAAKRKHCEGTADEIHLAKKLRVSPKHIPLKKRPVMIPFIPSPAPASENVGKCDNSSKVATVTGTKTRKRTLPKNVKRETSDTLALGEWQFTTFTRYR